MTARLIDGKAIAKELREEIAREVPTLGFQPGLAVVQVGEDAASSVYVKNKVKTAQEIGFYSARHALPANVSQDALLELLEVLDNDPAIHGILVQLPLPRHINETAVLHSIDPLKDVDGFHPVNVGKLWEGAPDALVPCTPLGCSIMLKKSGVALAGKNAVVIGRSNIVGKPMAALLLREHCTVTIAHSRTENLPELVKRADIVVAAVGKPEFVKGSWLKPGATVIDVGINRVDGKLVGDVAFAEASQIAGAITPVPGGVGPMTIACLLKNTLTAAKVIKSLDKN